MTDEIVDIVDGNNHVVGQIIKSKAHKQGVLHRVIIAELIDSQGNFTFVKQASDRQDPGQFVSPVGGHIKAGETEIEALVRESEEELGITPVKYKRLGQAIYNRKVIGRQENHYFIVYEIYSNKIPVLNHESIDHKKYSKSVINELIKSKPTLFGAALHFVWTKFYT
jgi:8-oxo-dGTP pyrophosphatase MutT (NUDIX family)